MDLKYKFNANEYAALLQISASALRKRRLSGKLEGQYIKIDSKYFYMTPLGDRPIKDEFTMRGSRSKPRRRNVHGSSTMYHKARNGHQLKLANDIKQLARINRRLSEEQIAEITDDIFEVAKQRRMERVREQNKLFEDNLNTKKYGGKISCSTSGYKDVKTNWRPLFPKPKDEYDRYLDDNNDSESCDPTFVQWNPRYY
jgi:hypothetical protein